jgi:hypothetical protein
MVSLTFSVQTPKTLGSEAKARIAKNCLFRQKQLLRTNEERRERIVAVAPERSKVYHRAIGY